MSLTHILIRRSRFLVIGGLLCALLSVAVSFLFPLEYRADAQILILSESTYGIDPYTAVKSTERIGENLSRIVKTSDFYNKVFALGVDTIDQTPYQNVSEQKRRKRWQKNVNASVVFGTSIMTFSAYHRNPEEAKKMVNAVAQTMLTHSRDYVSSNIGMRVVNQPFVTEYPVRPNMVVRAVLGFVFGVFVSILLLSRRPLS